MRRIVVHHPNRRQFIATSGMAVPAFLVPQRALGDDRITVEIDSGKLRGSRDKHAIAFKGIPYAAPTGGANRFKAPQPVEAWSGVREAVRFGDRCVQEHETFGDAPILAWYAQSEPFSENCCVLNVYTPATDRGRRPVMVYIHGGGYVTGGGGGEILDGSALAEFGDVVVVTLNHRLNVFGYLNLGHIDTESFGDAANAGQLDLIAALRWIQRNIAVFGGDPGNVTLFGQSGGGSKIMVLMGMPAAKGLFHRAINMSGTSGMNVAAAQATEAYVDTFLEHLGIDKSGLRRLQQVPTDKLIEARLAAVRARREGSRPVVDGRHVVGGPMTPQALPLHASVPLLIGTAKTEATFYFADDVRHMRLSERQVRERLKAQFGIDDEKAAALMASFRRDDPQRTPSEVLVALITNTLFRLPMLQAAEVKANAGQAPVYLYNFVWKTPVAGGLWGSPHTVDIPFAFGTTDKASALLGTGPETLEVSKNLMSAFVAFARSGNPNNPRMPAWKPFDAASRATMTVDVQCRAVNDYLSGDRTAAAAVRLDPFNRAALMTYKD
ncbi:carboxylesterase/lipase family protein [Azohydromonas australica]|uniref:carboxylesterase/lipase family protein n=1 Tax=Azohydromonas australica TaxID=364039 RepID=UPI001EE45687|nr:carboxylesterase family protein [Azohydromonas australica]